MSVQCLNKLTRGFERGEVDKVSLEKGMYINRQWKTRSEIKIVSGLLELEPLLKSCIVCLQQESDKTHKRLLAHRAELMLDNSREMIMFLEFLWSNYQPLNSLARFDSLGVLLRGVLFSFLTSFSSCLLSSGPKSLIGLSLSLTSSLFLQYLTRSTTWKMIHLW